VAPSLEYRIDGRPWTRSAVAVVPAPADHSGDGVHQVEYRATDHVGRVSRSRCTWVGIDTQPPTVVIANDVVARRGRTALLSFTPDDLLSASARCSVTIARRGKTVLRLRNATCPTGRKRSLKYLCDLKPGVYTWSVSAVDAAGNVAPKAAAAKLTVRR
jgi:hypothetical protein